MIVATSKLMAGSDPIKFSDDKTTKKILFIAGKPGHGHGNHEYRAGSMLLADALNKSKLNIEAKVHWYGWPKDASIFDKVDLTVIYADAGGRMNQRIQKLMDEKVSKGMGIMFIHYGVHPSPKVGQKYFLKWTGAYFKNGASVNPHWIANITPLKDHPVGFGITEPIKAFDEFYYNMIKKKDCPHCLKLASATPTPDSILRYNNLWNKAGDDLFGKSQALMWARDSGHGAGRGVGWVGGHYHSNWAKDDFRTLTLNAIAWAAKVEIPKTGVPSAKVTLEMLNANLDINPAPFQITAPRDDIFDRNPMPRPTDPANYKNQRKNNRLSPMWKKGDPVDSKGNK